MSRNPSVSLTQHQSDFIAGLVDSGRYHGVSDVFRAGLRLLEEKEERREAALAYYEAAVREGVESGPAENMEPIDDIISEARRSMGD